MNTVRLIAISLVLVSQLVWGMNVNPTFSGSWFNPNQSGHGLSVEVLDEDRSIFYWYAYHTDGSPMFLFVDGSNKGNEIVGTAYYFSGMAFGDFNPDDNTREVWGSVTLSFSSCSAATLKYRANDPTYGSGSIPMTKLASIPGVKCVNNPMQNNYHLTAIFENEQEVGFGFMWVFEDGYTGFLAIGEGVAKTGFGWMTEVSDDRFELEFWLYDLLGAGWEHQYAAGEFSSDSIEVNLAGGILLGTGLKSFERGLAYSDVAETYDIREALSGDIIGYLTLDSRGNANGKTFDGCDLSGTYVIPDTQFNQVYTEIELADCSAKPSMFGTGFIDEHGALGFALSDRQKGKFWVLER